MDLFKLLIPFQLLGYFDFGNETWILALKQEIVPVFSFIKILNNSCDSKIVLISLLAKEQIYYPLTSTVSLDLQMPPEF